MNNTEHRKEGSVVRSSAVLMAASEDRHGSANGEDMVGATEAHHPVQTEKSSEAEVQDWSTERVCQWLQNCGFPDLAPTFTQHRVDGRLLLEIDESFAQETLEISNALIRRKLARRVELLRQREREKAQTRTLDEVDEYVSLLGE